MGEILESLKDNTLQDLIRNSIEDQSPSWKNHLSRCLAFSSSEEHFEPVGVWFSKAARRFVFLATVVSGSIFLGDLTFQNMPP